MCLEDCSEHKWLYVFTSYFGIAVLILRSLKSEFFTSYLLSQTLNCFHIPDLAFRLPYTIVGGFWTCKIFSIFHGLKYFLKSSAAQQRLLVCYLGNIGTKLFKMLCVKSFYHR